MPQTPTTPLRRLSWFDALFALRAPPLTSLPEGIWIAGVRPISSRWASLLDQLVFLFVFIMILHFDAMPWLFFAAACGLGAQRWWDTWRSGAWLVQWDAGANAVRINPPDQLPKHHTTVPLADVVAVQELGPANRRCMQFHLQSGRAVRVPLHVSAQEWMLNLDDALPAWLEQHLNDCGKGHIPIQIEPEEPALTTRTSLLKWWRQERSAPRTVQDADGIHVRFPGQSQASIHLPSTLPAIALFWLAFCFGLFKWWNNGNSAIAAGVLFVLGVLFHLLLRAKLNASARKLVPYVSPDQFGLTNQNGLLWLALSQRESAELLITAQVQSAHIVNVPARVPSARWRLRLAMASGLVVEQAINVFSKREHDACCAAVSHRLQQWLGADRVKIDDGWPVHLQDDQMNAVKH